MKKITLPVFLVLTILTSCAVRKTTEGERVITIEPTTKADTIKPVVVDTAIKVTPGPMVTQQPVRLKEGWRVQIFAFADKSKAELAYQDAKLRLNVPVYLEYIPGIDNVPYKIRVGNFQTREEAERYRDFLRENGYPDAFLVETQIELP
uniref:SPOR domain-containing protein n=1 Tax=candidate division WOR-3 bacterium TaxID=2052148 RepID=A0A7C2K4J5_UNCW3